MSANGRTALVTGSTGFVGQHLTEALLARGWTVKAPIRRQHVRPKHARSMHFPISDLLEWANQPGDALSGVDTIFHLAARVHERGLQHQDGEYQAVNVDATEALAAQAQRAGVRRFVFVSSIKAMGESCGDQPLEPDTFPAPTDAYGRSKYQAEYKLRGVLNEGVTTWCIVRPPLIYGPNARANLALLVRCLQLRIPLPFAAIENRRSLIGVGNFAQLLADVAVRDSAGGRVLLPADGDWSTPGLIRHLGAAVGRTPLLFSVPPALLQFSARAAGQLDRLSSLTESLFVRDPWLADELRWQPPQAASDGLTEMARKIVNVTPTVE